MDYDSYIVSWVTLWGVLIAILLVNGLLRKSSMGVGLVSTYVLFFSVLHVPAAVSKILPWNRLGDLQLVEEGLRQGVFGLGGLVAGCIVSSLIFFLARYHRKSNEPEPVPEKVSVELADFAATQRKPLCSPMVPRVLIAVGALAYIVLRIVLNAIPTVTAILSTAVYVMVAGLCLACWNAWVEKKILRMLGWVTIALTLPLLTTMVEGLMTYGALMLIIVLSCLASYVRPRRVVVVCALAFLYLALSGYVVYMKTRQDIRTVVWGKASLLDRANEVSRLITEFELFNPYDREHLFLVEVRLDQDTLVGSAVRRLETTGDFAGGSTIGDSVLALVPRALWSDKPIFAGGGRLVSEYTGITFADGTSIGMGQVFEFYINFGTPGVVVGLFFFGMVLSLLNSRAADAIREGNWKKFLLYFMPGVGMLQPGGSLVEITATCGAALAVSFAITSVFREKFVELPEKTEEASMAAVSQESAGKLVLDPANSPE